MKIMSSRSGKLIFRESGATPTGSAETRGRVKCAAWSNTDNNSAVAFREGGYHVTMSPLCTTKQMPNDNA